MPNISLKNETVETRDPAHDISPITNVEPTAIWKFEAQDFTPWLAANLDLLGEALGLDLEFESKEVAVGDFYCDLIATEIRTARKVVIENQYGSTDHKHLGQLLTYAGGQDARVLIWIAPEIRDEHRQAVDFLNRNTTEDMDFFLVELRVFRIENSKNAVEFRPVSMPNAWSKYQSRRAVRNSDSLSARSIAYQDFWQPLIDALRDKYQFTNSRAKRTQSWVFFASGVSGIRIGAAFAGKNRLQVELYIDVGDQETNKAIFENLRKYCPEIERNFDQPLVWEVLDNAKASRIRIDFPNITLDQIAGREEEIRHWLITNIIKFKDVFSKYLRNAVETAHEEIERKDAQ